MQILQNLDKIEKTPIYVVEEAALKRNCELLAKIKEQSGAKILLALKAFSFTASLKLISKYLDGATCSGLWEAKLAKEFMGKEIHTYSPAFKDDEIDEITELSNHIVFNSLNQLNKYKDKALKKGKSIGLRVNPELSLAPKALYNPCARFSRLGILAKDLKDEHLQGVSGLHFHALCEESAESLELVLKSFEDKFGKFFKKLRWLNFGGGHHISKKGYNVDKLIKLCKDFSSKYNLEIYLEPGEAVAWQCGSLVSSVIDIVHNEKNIALLDTSNEAHMPDTVIMPYTSEVANARILEKNSKPKQDEHSFLLAGISCLAGDVMGEYAFKKELKVNDKVVFLDQAHYSIVKNTTFNGVRLPSLGFLRENGDLELVKSFSYEDFKRRN